MKLGKRLLVSLLVACFAVTILVPVTVKAENETQDLTTTIGNDNELSILAELLTMVGLDDALEGEGPYTVLAPTNAAFEKLGPEALANLKKVENKDKLEDTLLNHVFSGNVPSNELLNKTNEKVIMLNGKPVVIAIRNGEVNFNNSKVINKDIKASNGVIHKIDTVILPQE